MAETAGPTLVELRVLDGANLYFPRPAIKLTLDVPELLSLPAERAAAVASEVGLVAGSPGPPGGEQRRRFATRLLAHLVRRTAAAAGVRALAVRSPDMGWFPGAIADQGRPDLTRELLAGRRDDFLRAALNRLDAEGG